ncbi:TIGR03067 domain-containing protein [Candidatus Laterigemmans baculatus]|uniref:TIGR03067 domain-containing protein n=1 Tax=Candidatus Laterigemmans baculatus TaxID=2770505 RepID=UPI0013DA813E|nr:TIGR03067 domain-containing protein [Candidatus Laterigemmans baculatus]
MRLLVTFLVCVIGSPLTALATEQGADKDQEALEGKWVLTSVEGAGIMLSESELKRLPRGFIFENGTAKSFHGDAIRAEGTYKTDPKTMPKQLDITLMPPGTSEGETVLALYKLNRERLTLCNRLPGKERPAEFAANETTMIAVYVREPSTDENPRSN